jgi:membrane protein YdbS with pleckstrin-like domain
MTNPATLIDPHVDRFVMSVAGEKKVIEIHKHWIVLLWPAIRLILAITVTIWALTLEGNWFWAVWLLGFTLGFHAMWRILTEYRDRFMISTIRLFRTHGVLATQRAAIPISRVVDITVDRPAIGRWLNYGHFKFESAAQIQGLYRISYVKDIDEVENILYTVISGDLPLPREELVGDGT